MNGSVDKTKGRILVVDDEEEIRVLLLTIFKEAGYDVAVASGAEEAISLFRKEPADVIVADYMMPDMNGLELLEATWAFSPRPRTVMLTGYASVDMALEAARLGTVTVLTKPFVTSELLELVEKAVGEARAERDGTCALEKPDLFTESEKVLAETRRIFENLRRRMAPGGVHVSQGGGVDTSADGGDGGGLSSKTHADADGPTAAPFAQDLAAPEQSLPASPSLPSDAAEPVEPMNQAEDGTSSKQSAGTVAPPSVKDDVRIVFGPPGVERLPRAVVIMDIVPVEGGRAAVGVFVDDGGRAVRLDLVGPFCPEGRIIPLKKVRDGISFGKVFPLSIEGRNYFHFRDGNGDIISGLSCRFDVRGRRLDELEDPYQVLGLERNSTIDEVRAAYLELSAPFRSDRSEDGRIANGAALGRLFEAYQRIRQDIKDLEAAFDPGYFDGDT